MLKIFYVLHVCTYVCVYIFGNDVILWFMRSRDFIQDVHKLVKHKSSVVTSELEVTIWSGRFQKLPLVLKFSFKRPDGVTLVKSRDVIFYLNCTVDAWIGRGGTIAWPLL